MIQPVLNVIMKIQDIKRKHHSGNDAMCSRKLCTDFIQTES